MKKNLYSKDKDGYTAIGRACRNGSLKEIKSLLRNFPEIDLAKGRQNLHTKEWDLSAFDIAAQIKSAEIVKHLSSYDPTCIKKFQNVVKLPNESGEILIKEKVYNSEQELADRMRQLVQIINLQTSDQVKNTNNLFSNAQDQLDSLNKGVTSALKSSIKNQLEEKISSLSQHVSYVRDLSYLHDTTPENHELFTAIKKDNIRAVETICRIMPSLIDRGNSLHQTSLHYAARQAKDKILEFLIAKSENLNPLDVMGFSPLDYALKEMHTSTVALLIKHGIIYSKYQSDYQQALQSKDTKQINKLEKYITLLKLSHEIPANYAVETDHCATKVEIISIESASTDLLDDAKLLGDCDFLWKHLDPSH